MSLNQWFRESTMRGAAQSSFQLEEQIYEKSSKFQTIKVYETKGLGRLMTLDDSAMISEHDEFIYHEVMSHIPLLIQNRTKNVLIIGGGDGGIARELVRYRIVENIDLVEIDKEVVTTAKEFFPNVSCGLDDPRVHLYFEDGIHFLRDQCRKNEEYDLIIIDSTDPVGLAKGLYTKEIFQMIHHLLSDEGIFMSQTGTPFFDEFDIRKNYSDLKEYFPIVEAVCAPILIYPGVYWTFALSSKRWSAKDLKKHKLDEYKDFSRELKWHNPQWQMTSTTLSNYYREIIFGGL